MHLLGWGRTSTWAKKLTQHRANFAKLGMSGEVEILAIEKEEKSRIL
jgi:hypothetical protein